MGILVFGFLSLCYGPSSLFPVPCSITLRGRFAPTVLWVPLGSPHVGVSSLAGWFLEGSLRPYPCVLWVSVELAFGLWFSSVFRLFSGSVGLALFAWGVCFSLHLHPWSWCPGWWFSTLTFGSPVPLGRLDIPPLCCSGSFLSHVHLVHP